MENNKDYLSRRLFFKKVANGVLPFLGAIVMSGMPVNLFSKEKTPMGCNAASCTGSCYTHCYHGCNIACTSCTGTCDGTCVQSCLGSCVGSCLNTCTTSCMTTCYNTSKGNESRQNNYSGQDNKNSSNRYSSCNDCSGSCKGSCSGSCKGSCSGSNTQSTTSNANHAISNSSNTYAWLSTRLATENDLSGKTKADIRIMRNTIYAMHGYIFRSQDLKSYFGKKSWYKPKKTDVSNELSSIEKRNIQFLKNHE